MKKLLTFVLALSFLVLLTGCGKEAENEKKEEANNDANGEKTVYIVGFDNTFAPMGFEKDGENVGFDIDLAKKMEEKLGVTFEFQPIDWTIKETELDSKNIDMIWNGYSITEERKEKVLFSIPYMDNRELILVNKKSDIETKDDLKGKIVCTQGESSAEDALMKDDISKDLAEVVTYPSFNEVFSDLKNERCDAIIIDETMGLYYLNTSGEGDLYRVLEDDLGKEQYAVGFRKEDTEFVEKFNKALQELIDSGEVDKIYKKWFQ